MVWDKNIWSGVPNHDKRVRLWSYLLVQHRFISSCPKQWQEGRLWSYLLVQHRFISSCPKPVHEGETVMVLISSTPLHIFLSQVSTITVSPSCHGLRQEDMKRCWTNKYDHSLPSCHCLGQEDMKRCWTGEYHHSLPLLSWFACPKPVHEGETVMVLTSSTPLHIFLSQTMTRGGDCHGTY
jgi:hypothetical protein